MAFCINDTATTESYTLSLHDALPILLRALTLLPPLQRAVLVLGYLDDMNDAGIARIVRRRETTVRSLRSEEHTSELQSRQYLVCRLLLEKKHRSTHRRHE